jgi:RNA polymerase sigma factor (TIGR02999 family)
MPAKRANSVDGETPASEEDIALHQLFAVMYDELRRVAHAQLRGEDKGHTLGTTALVHEAYLRLAPTGTLAISNRQHFFALAGRAMRHVLVDCARRYRGAQHGHGQPALTLQEELIAASSRAEEVLAIDAALQQLAAVDVRLARVVECRFFAGLNETETAEALGVTTRTVRRDWVKARGWLRHALGN